MSIQRWYQDGVHGDGPPTDSYDGSPVPSEIAALSDLGSVAEACARMSDWNSGGGYTEDQEIWLHDGVMWRRYQVTAELCVRYHAVEAVSTPPPKRSEICATCIFWDAPKRDDDLGRCTSTAEESGDETAADFWCICWEADR